jgi:hypothetical protein
MYMRQPMVVASSKRLFRGTGQGATAGQPNEVPGRERPELRTGIPAEISPG